MIGRDQSGVVDGCFPVQHHADIHVDCHDQREHGRRRHVCRHQRQHVHRQDRILRVNVSSSSSSSLCWLLHRNWHRFWALNQIFVIEIPTFEQFWPIFLLGFKICPFKLNILIDFGGIHVILTNFELKTNSLSFKNQNFDQFPINACDFDDFLPQNQQFALLKSKFFSILTIKDQKCD